MTWPTDRPGYPRDAWDGLPQNPERRGWHWLGFKGQHEQGREPWAWLWSDEDGAPGEFQWMTDDDGDPERMARQFTYLGPCYTQADLDAAVQAERDACDATTFDIANVGVGGGPTACMISRAIRARGTTPALDAALAQARREGAQEQYALGVIEARMAAADCLAGIKHIEPETSEAMREACKIAILQGGAFGAALASIRSAAAREEGT